MASATERKVAVMKIEEQTAGVRLNLSLEEARVLLAVTARIGGSPDLSPRGHMDSIRDALESELEILSTELSREYGITSSQGHLVGGLQFPDYPETKSSMWIKNTCEDVNDLPVVTPGNVVDVVLEDGREFHDLRVVEGHDARPEHDTGLVGHIALNWANFGFPWDISHFRIRN